MKTIYALSSIALFAAAAGLALSDCTVKPNESCLTGPCELPNLTATASAPTSSSTSTGAGGGDGGVTCKNPMTGDYPCAIYDILHRKCHPCHATDQLAISEAPFSLLTWEDSQQPYMPGFPRFMEMGMLIAPGGSPQMPFGCSSDCPPSGNLSSDERATLETWLTTCAVPVAEGKDQKCICKGVAGAPSAPCKPE